MNAVVTAPAATIDPEYAAKRLEALREGLKTLSNKEARTQALWESYGAEIVVAKDHAEGVELAKQGIPSKVWEFEDFTFVPAYLFASLDKAKKEAEERELAASTETAIVETANKILAADEERKQAIIQNNRLKSVTDMLKTPEIDWLVKDHVHRTGLFQLFGASYAGKTLITLDLVLSWCAGLEQWQGYTLCNDGQPQHAIYVAAEGGAAVSVHIDAWLKYHPEVTPDKLAGLRFLDGGDGDHMFLSVGKEGVDASDSWERLQIEIASLDLKPSLVVFDTQIDLAPGVDENSNTDMVGVLRRVKRMGDEYGFLAMVIHHTGHDGNKARGASGMMGKCDAQAKLTTIGEKSGKALLEWTKVKGRAVPEDSIRYHIQGSKFLPDLNSEGAVCVPIGALAAQVSAMDSKKPSQDLHDRIMTALGQGELSVRALSDAVGKDRGNKEFKNALEHMEWSSEIVVDVSNSRNHKVRLAPFALAPQSDPVD